MAYLLSSISTSPTSHTCEQQQTIYLSTNGVHLDIIIPQNQLISSFQKNLKIPFNTTYLAFGWGDKGFYLNTPTWEDLTATTAINAFFFNSETAMHITPYRFKQKKWIALPLCPTQLTQLQQYIEASFTKHKNGTFQIIPNAGYTTTDAFYEANYSYNGINTCNNWINNALKSADIKTAIWSPFDSGILYHFEK